MSVETNEIGMWPFSSGSSTVTEQKGVVNLNELHSTISEHHDRATVLILLIFIMVAVLIFKALWKMIKGKITKEERRRTANEQARSMMELA